MVDEQKKSERQGDVQLRHTKKHAGTALIDGGPPSVPYIHAWEGVETKRGGTS